MLHLFFFTVPLCKAQDTIIKISSADNILNYEGIKGSFGVYQFISIDTLTNEFLYFTDNNGIRIYTAGDVFKKKEKLYLINNKKIWSNYLKSHDSILEISNKYLQFAFYSPKNFEVNFINNQNEMIFFYKKYYQKNEENFWIDSLNLKFDKKTGVKSIKIKSNIQTNNNQILNAIDGRIFEITKYNGLFNVRIFHGELYSFIKNLKSCNYKEGNFVNANDSVGEITSSTDYLLYGNGLIPPEKNK